MHIARICNTQLMTHIIKNINDLSSMNWTLKALIIVIRSCSSLESIIDWRVFQTSTTSDGRITSQMTSELIVLCGGSVQWDLSEITQQNLPWLMGGSSLMISWDHQMGKYDSPHILHAVYATGCHFNSLASGRCVNNVKKCCIQKQINLQIKFMIPSCENYSKVHATEHLWA